MKFKWLQILEIRTIKQYNSENYWAISSKEDKNGTKRKKVQKRKNTEKYQNPKK